MAAGASAGQRVVLTLPPSDHARSPRPRGCPGMGTVPLATSVGGQFREQLMATARKAKWPLRIELSCTSFTQAARAVKAGAVGAVLPSLAAVELAPPEVVQFELPFLKSYARSVGIAWNPRLTGVRPLVERAVSCMQSTLAG